MNLSFFSCTFLLARRRVFISFTSRQASPLESFQIKMTKQISFQDIYSRIIIFFDQTLRRPSIPILVSVKHPMSNTRFKSMQNDLHTSLLHGQLSRLETGGGEVVGGLLFCWGFFLPQSATHTVTQSADTALAMRLERNEKPTCASVKRANGGLSPSTKINCEQGRT